MSREIRQRLEALWIALGHHHRLAGIHVVDDVDHLAALGLVKQLVDDHVALSGQQCGEQSGKGNDPPFHLLVAQALGDLQPQVHGQSLGFLRLIEGHQRRRIHARAVDEFIDLEQTLRDNGRGNRPLCTEPEGYSGK
ncbi:hypothetical protein D3C84_982500 [compost metagenome]